MTRGSRFFLASAILVVALIGVVVGWLLAQRGFAFRVGQLENQFRNALQAAATSSTELGVVPVERRRPTPIYPPAFVSRRVSPILSLVKNVPAKDGSVTLSDHAVGNAVALSSDGWLAAPASLFHATRVKDIAAVWNGQTYSIKTAIHDLATNAVFLQIDAHDLPQVALVQASDVAPGLDVWLEPHPGRLFASSVNDIRLHMTQPISSERVTRRFSIEGIDDATGIGGGVWDEGGQLVGLLESKASDGWRVLPAGFLSRALDSVLAGKPIRHPLLGIKSIDLSEVAFAERHGLPKQGAWVTSVGVGDPALSKIFSGDVIERIERDMLDENADVGERLLDYAPGARVTLSGERKGQPVEAAITLGSWTASENFK